MKEIKQGAEKKYNFQNLSLTSLGWELALPIFGGALLGFQLDKVIETNYLITLVMIIGGIAIGYYNLIKLIELEMLRTKAAKKYQEKRDFES
jgi:F0F1-type ATP synthase assembly protein I